MAKDARTSYYQLKGGQKGGLTARGPIHRRS